MPGIVPTPTPPLKGRGGLGLALIATALLAGCGGKGPLMYAAGEKTPPVPVGRETAPTTEEMLTPPPQGKPDRVDDPVSRSAPRTTDRFNLPPPR